MSVPTRRVYAEIATILLLSLALAGATAVFGPSISLPVADPLLPGDVTPPEVARMKRVLWIDARPVGAYENQHIHGAISLPHPADDVPRLLIEQAWLAGRPVVVYGDTGSSAIDRMVAAKIRAAVPGARVYTMRGGIDAWPPGRR